MTKNEAEEHSVILAAGGIISRQSPEGTEVLIIYRSRYKDWCLPKGKLKDKELFEDAAIREVKEETGCKTRITGFVGCVCYEVKQKQKVVLFWNMEAVGECSFEPSEEVKETRWVNIKEALTILDYPKERDLLVKIFNKP